jgi:hypothetical protein
MLQMSGAHGTLSGLPFVMAINIRSLDVTRSSFRANP